MITKENGKFNKKLVSFLVLLFFLTLILFLTVLDPFLRNNYIQYARFKDVYLFNLMHKGFDADSVYLSLKKEDRNKAKVYGEIYLKTVDNLRDLKLILPCLKDYNNSLIGRSYVELSDSVVVVHFNDLFTNCGYIYKVVYCNGSIKTITRYFEADSLEVTLEK